MGTQKGGMSAIKMFFQENRTLAFSIPVLVVLVIVVIVVYSAGSGTGKAAVPTAADSSISQAQTIEILPDTEREVTGSASIENNSDGVVNSDSTAIKNPFSGPIILTGVLTDSDGDNIAVIQANNKSYIVKNGDVLEESVTVESISADEVTLKNGDRIIDLKLEKRRDSQSVTK